MASFNQITLLGNLTRDPQFKYLPNQTPLVEFGIAINRKFKSGDGQDREEVLFIDCVCFGKGAEVINNYCQKGKQLLVSGRLKYDTWEDKHGGGKRSKHSVVVDNFQLMGSRQDSENPVDKSLNAPPVGGGRRQPSNTPPLSPEQQFQESEIPFLWHDHRSPA